MLRVVFGAVVAALVTLAGHGAAAQAPPDLLGEASSSE